jgi:hypothetical protein
MKCLKIPKGGLETVNLRRTDKTIAKRNRTNNDLQNNSQKNYYNNILIILHKKTELTRFGMVSSS